MARFDGGWIKIYRSLGEGDIPQRSTFTLGLFVRLLLMANWRESKAYFGGQQIVLKPGQLITGLRELSPEADEDPYLHRARRSLQYLELTGRIQQATSNRGRLITINNWQSYQLLETPSVSVTQSESNQRAIRAQLSEEVKKERKSARSRKPPTDGSVLFNYYAERLFRQHGVEAIRDAKANTHAKDLVTIHGLDRAKSLIDAFLADSDEFVKNQAWQLGLLVSQQQKYLARISQQTRKPLKTLDDLAREEASHG